MKKENIFYLSDSDIQCMLKTANHKKDYTLWDLRGTNYDNRIFEFVMLWGVKNDDNNISGLRELFKSIQKTGQFKQDAYVTNIIIQVLNFLEEAIIKNEFFLATDLLEILCLTKYPDFVKKLKKIERLVDKEAELKHYNWATEYIPASPLLMIKNLIKKWKKTN